MDMAAAPGMGPLGRLRSAGCTCLVREHCQLRHQAHDPRLRLCSCQYRCACDLTPLGGAGGKGPLPCIPFFPHVGASEDVPLQQIRCTPATRRGPCRLQEHRQHRILDEEHIA